jgi:hypothetical protein
MDGRKALAKAFGAYVADHSLSQTDVAARGGPSTTSQTKIQKATKPISPQTLQKIDKATGWPPGTSARILAGTSEPTEQRTIEGYSNEELADEVRRRLLLRRSEPDDEPVPQKSPEALEAARVIELNRQTSEQGPDPQSAPGQHSPDSRQ